MEVKEERPPFVQFETRTEQDKEKSLAFGRWVGKDVDYVRVTPPYTKDELIYTWEEWIARKRADVANLRFRPEWIDRFVRQHAAWKEGREIPLDGTPILGWGMISPAQQQELVRLKIRTVEDLAGINDEAKHYIGMGAENLKASAIAWLEEAKSLGANSARVAALEQENRNLKGEVATLKDQVQSLIDQGANDRAMAEATVAGMKVFPPKSEVASELVDDLDGLREQYQRRFNRPAHPLMKAETIRQRLLAAA